MAVDLRTDLHLTTLTGLERIDDLLEPLGRQILVCIFENHHHGRIDARAKALHLFPRKRTARVRVERLRVNMLTTNSFQIFRAAQHTGRRSTDLNMRARADGLQLKLGVEGGDFQYADHRHAQAISDMLDRRLGHPAFLILSAHQQRDDR
ncbi:hypothetical protein NS365_00225 [Aureimonas ureilytica]|uniref:Uncharacterized protein n=1 Tax=Aureimonas ureilytica TaxID=401562 RepID=A0A147DB79_9HYPH|nr:hypothetical protein NS365_00225 [Aureimonas ureilytica]